MDNLYRKRFENVRTGVLTNNQRKNLNIKPTKYFEPWELLEKINVNILYDFENLRKKNLIHKSKSYPIFYYAKEQFFEQKFEGVVFNDKNGPIIIGKDVIVKPFSYLEGPIFIEEQTILNNCRIYGNSIIGKNCRISGEISNSHIGNFSNKSHESALLNSYVGDWCNISGYSNTTNLNIGYNNINVKFKNKIIDTCCLKFGAFIGDFVRIGSGITIYPGTFFDIGVTIIELPKAKGYYNCFTKFKRGKIYSLNSFFDEYKTIMARRNQKFSEEQLLLIKEIYAYENE